MLPQNDSFKQNLLFRGGHGGRIARLVRARARSLSLLAFAPPWWPSRVPRPRRLHAQQIGGLLRRLVPSATPELGVPQNFYREPEAAWITSTTAHLP